MLRWFRFSVALLSLVALGCVTSNDNATADDIATANEEGWVSLFDGESLNGWKKAMENEESWQVKDGDLVCKGPRCHLFYVGEEAPWKNFHFKAEVMTLPGSNSGIYFHTRYQKTGWPTVGHESQVNNSHTDPVRTGSLYAVELNKVAPAKDNQWFIQEVIVQGKHVLVKVDGRTIIDYTEPADQQPGDSFERVLNEGTFAFQAHDPDSEVHFRNVEVKRLP